MSVRSVLLFLIVFLVTTCRADDHLPELLDNAEFLNNIHYHKNSAGEVDDIDPNIIQDAFLKTHELIAKYGYPAEVHKVETSDGYILEMHRIARPGAQPVFLLHGLLDASSTWVVMGPQKGLGYLLHDLGYDVWLGNVRGNRYSRNHKTLSPDKDKSKFWSFSWHEIGLYDVPAMIDYTLNNTGFQKLHYIGHSQGTTTFFVMTSERPEYNEKIISMQALAPSAYSKHCKSPLLNVALLFLDTIETISKMLGLYEFLPNSELLSLASQKLCQDESWTQDICSNVIFQICGYNPEQLNKTMLPVLTSHAPAGSSSKQLIHYGQLVGSGHFRKYDYGWIQNLFKYKRLSPPDYDLSKVTAKVALHYSNYDYLAQPDDVNMLYSQLPNPIGKYIVLESKFNHLDFVWAIDARELLYNKVVKILKMTENGEL